MASVGRAYAVLRHRLSGNKQEAADFLNSMSRPQLQQRNRLESRARSSSVKKYPRRGSRLGDRMRRRRRVGLR